VKIGVMSDSHDNVPNIKKALAIFESAGCEALIHTGDIVAPFSVREILKFKGQAFGIFGNNDGEVAGIKKIWEHIFHSPFLLELGGLRILVSHDEADLPRAPYSNIDVRIFGHSHKAEVRPGRTLELNPGETGGWLTGTATCAILDTEGPTAEIREIK